MVADYLPDNVLTITYTEFPLSFNGPQTYDLEYHLRNLIQHTLVGLLTSLQAGEAAPPERGSADAASLRRLSLAYLADIDRLHLDRSLRALRSLSERHADFWRNWGAGLGTVAAYALAAVFGHPAPGPLVLPQPSESFKRSPLDDFQALGALCKNLGIDAVYVLVDRVDELEHTQNNWSEAYRFVAPLLTNLGVIESSPFAFKFFLTSELEYLWLDSGGREDRIRTFRTAWTHDELIGMVDKRLAAYTDAPGPSIEIVTGDAQWTNLILMFAGNSPRDLIRLWDQCVIQAVRLQPNTADVSFEAKSAALDEFCRQRANEIAGRTAVQRLQQIHLADFSVANAADRLSVGNHTARRYIRDMEQRGVISSVPARVSTGPGRPETWYALQDTRVARVVFPEMSLPEFFSSKIRHCANGHHVIRDWELWTGGGAHSCPDCGAQVPISRPDVPSA